MATPNELQDNTDLRVAVGVIQSQVSDMKVVLGRVEKKIDNNNYVHESKYSEDRKEDSAEYATKSELRAIDKKYAPMLTLGITILTTIVIGLVTAFMAFVVRGGIK